MHSNRTNVDAFILALATDRASMEEIRKDISDIVFAEKYGVSAMTIVNHMGCKNRYKISESRFDVDAINKLRITQDDVDIAKEYKCSVSTIQKRCGKKSLLGIPRKKPIHRAESVTSITRRLEIETCVIRKEDRWEYSVEKPYWMQNDAIISGDNPHPYLREKLA